MTEGGGPWKRGAGADPGFFAGGGGATTAVYSGRLRLRYIASIEYSERFFCFSFAIVKKFVGKKNGGREQGGGGHDPQPLPLDPRLGCVQNEDLRPSSFCRNPVGNLQNEDPV